MPEQPSLRTLGEITHLVSVLIWPLVLLYCLRRFKEPIDSLFRNIEEVSLKAFGVDFMAKRREVEAAALFGAATAARPPAEGGLDPAAHARGIAALVHEAVSPASSRRLGQARVLWVDDRPENNSYERQAMEALGVRFTLAHSTDQALEHVERTPFHAIISDMGRPPDPQAGYTLLESLRKRGSSPPFIIYAGSSSPEHRAEARRRGGWGTTSAPQELFELLLSALKSQGFI